MENKQNVFSNKIALCDVLQIFCDFIFEKANASGIAYRFKGIPDLHAKNMKDTLAYYLRGITIPKQADTKGQVKISPCLYFHSQLVQQVFY